MPQATDELRAEWPGGDEEAIDFLSDAGFKLNKDWSWSRPTPDHMLTPREVSAVCYLIDEWDFDGVRP